MTNETLQIEPGPDPNMAALARPQEGRGPSGRARTSKIARLPARIREELNERLLDGEVPAGIVAWLNSLPAVQRVLARSFASQPITEVNLCRWRQGGYARWFDFVTSRGTDTGMGAPPAFNFAGLTLLLATFCVRFMPIKG